MIATSDEKWGYSILLLKKGRPEVLEDLHVIDFLSHLPYMPDLVCRNNRKSFLKMR